MTVTKLSYFSTYRMSRLMCIAVYVNFEDLVVLLNVFGTCKLGL